MRSGLDRWNLNNTDGKVYGSHNVVTSINPYKCYFVAYYVDKVRKGNNLFNTGWDELPDGIVKLQYMLSTGHVIEIPKFKAYLHLVEVSMGTNGHRMFHAVNIKGLGNNEVINYRIILQQGNTSKYKIGDIIMTRDTKPTQSKSWKASV